MFGRTSAIKYHQLAENPRIVDCNSLVAKFREVFYGKNIGVRDRNGSFFRVTILGGKEKLRLTIRMSQGLVESSVVTILGGINHIFGTRFELRQHILIENTLRHTNKNDSVMYEGTAMIIPSTKLLFHRQSFVNGEIRDHLHCENPRDPQDSRDWTIDREGAHFMDAREMHDWAIQQGHGGLTQFTDPDFNIFK
jgi:hypothetical protein